MTRISALLAAVLLIFSPLLLTGCGGGGGNGESGTISGTVTDIAGNLIPGASVEVLGAGNRTKSLLNGVYKLTGVKTGWVTVKASATIDGRQWLGYQVVQVYSDGPAQSMNIVMGPVSELGEFRGVVTNASGKPLENVRIFASANYPGNAAGPDSSHISIVAFTDRDGKYRLTEIPSRIRVNGVDQVVEYKLLASYTGEEGMPVGFDNDEALGIIDPSPNYTVVNFVLSVSTDILVDTPDDWYLGITSWTLPNNIISRGTGGYDAVRAHVSDSFARMLAARKGVKRSPPPDSLIEIDVSWLESWTTFLDDKYGGSPQPNLAGFAIYRRTDSAPRVSDADLLDFVRDPFLTYYGDTSSELTVGREYFYGVTAVSTSYLNQFDQFNPDSESAMSDVISVVPIDRLVVTGPANGQSVSASTLSFSWERVTGASSYQVFLYSDYPVLDSGVGGLADHVTLPVWESIITSDTSVEYDGGALSPGTYYWVVIGSSGSGLSGPAYSIGELRSLNVR